jgi:hypothetical protein
MGGMNDGQMPGAPGRPRDRFAWLAAATLALLLVVGEPGVERELQFFLPGAVISQDGSAPVPQDDPRNPAVDAAFREAASDLPASATCVIDQDTWNEDYFRASYIMMPRQVWPYTGEADGGTPSAADIRVAMIARHATCALLRAGTPEPTSLVRLTFGAYSLYVSHPAGSE